MSIRLRFANTDERDEFLTEHFPRRKATETPGFYTVPGFGEIGVFCEQVTLYPIGGVL